MSSEAAQVRSSERMAAQTQEPARAPIPLHSPGWAGAADRSRLAQLTLGFVVLGILLRVVRYLLDFPLWCDETMLAANFLDRDYMDLFRPLDYRQVAPVLFLVIELATVKLLGFTELTLRLFPFVCGVLSVPLFRHVAGRVLGGVPLLLAVAVFAVSGWPLRYVAEVKPYASDLFVALMVLALGVEWWRRPDRVGWLWLLAAWGPIAVGLSFPALLVTAGVGLGLAPTVWRTRKPSAWLAYVTYGLGVVATFVLLLGFYKTAPQDHAYFHRNWAPAFPPLDSLPRLVAWFLAMNTGFMFAYPEGGERGLSSLTFLCFVLAAIVLWKQKRRTVLALCLLPFAVALVAAAMHRYPYGMSARTTQYAAPVICLLTGLGAATMLGAVRPVWLRRSAVIAVAVALAALGLGRMGYDLSHPYKTLSDERARAFARWFWVEKSLDSEVACVKEDLGTVFNPAHWTGHATDTYLCYQRIYSPRHRRGEKLRLDAVSAHRPLRCVLFNEYPQNAPAFPAWMAGMLERYELRKLEQYPVHSVEPKKGPTCDSVYVVYEFVPRRDRPASAVAEAPARPATRR